MAYLPGQPNPYLSGSPNQERLERESALRKFLVGAAVGVAAFALAARTGLLDEAAEFLATRGRAALRSVSLWWETRRPGFRSLSEEVATLRRIYGEELRRARAYRPGYLEELLLEKERVLTEELPFHWTESLRFADIIKAVREDFPGDRAVEAFVYRIRPGVLRSINKLDLAELARRERVSLSEEALERLFSIIESYRKKDYAAAHATFFAELQQRVNALLEEEIKRRTAPTTAWHTLLTGRRPATVGELLARGYPFPEETRKMLEGLVARDKSWAGLVFDPRIFITETGKIVDWRAFRDIRLGAMRWLEPTLPGRLLHLRDFLEMAEAPPFYILQRGTLHPVATGVPGPEGILGESLLVVGRKIVPVLRPDQPLPGEFALIPARFGLMERLLRSMADIGVTAPRTNKWYDRGFVGKVREFLDIGYSTSPTFWSRLRSFFGKFADEAWYRNVVEGAVRRGYAFDEATVEALRSFFASTTPAPSRRPFRVLQELAGYGGYSTETFEDLLRLVDVIASPPTFTGPLKSLWWRARRAPREVEKDVFLLAGRHAKRALQGEDIVRRELFKEFSRIAGFEEAKAALDAALKRGEITRREHLEALAAVNAAMFEEAAAQFRVEELRQQAVELVQKLFRSAETRRFQREVLDWARRTHPVWGPGPLGGVSALEAAGVVEDMPRAFTFGQRYTVVRAVPEVSEAVRAIREQNDWTKFKAVLKDLTYGPFVTGRGNLSEVTFNVIRPLSPYHLLWRLSEALNEFGLGFSGRSTASALDLYLSFALKRFLPVVAGWELLNYIDWEFDRLTGYSLYERWIRTVVRTRLGLAPDEEEAERLKHIYSMYPYLEQVAYWPHPSFPFIGYLFSYPLFGIGPRKPMSEEELKEYYATGYQEMRRGRFWFFGSRTPWWGSKVDYFLPNEYLMALSDWRYSSTMYPEDTYWKYNWLPTPRFPFASLQRLLRPYFWEEIHYYDRPYPLTGPAFEELTPWGPILNLTIGQLIKPQRIMHREELIAALSGAYPEVPLPPAQAVARGFPASAGQLRLVNDSIKYMARMSAGTAVPVAFVPKPPGTYAPAEEGAPGVVVQPAAAGGAYAYAPGAVADLRAINESIKAAGEFVPVFGFPPEYVAPGRVMVPTDVRYRLGELEYVGRELAGIYGFTVEALLGEVMPDVAVLQSAARAYNLEQRFWEANLGGLGGTLSEIGRRFLPHRMRHIEEINPIRNLMPPWLPGPEGLVDFLHGDPYSKIPYGEVRLPGEAYLRTHVVHPMPGYGLYGPVDIFLILADVAPWSPQARFWRDVVTHMDLPEDIRRQVAAAKRRMAAVKRKHTFYPYHFQTDISDLRFETVHVTKVLDLGMFLTEEYPEHPIRVAGVRAQSLTAEELSEFLRPGMAVTIAYDPRQKIADDTYRTIRAAVFINNLSLARMLIERGYASEALTDWSIAGVWSRFTPDEIARARFWERIAHLDTLIHTKFLAVRSPLESYIRERVYGEEWGDWKSPWSSWIVPTYQSFIARAPHLAALSGAATGWLIGQFLLGGRGKAGAVVGGALTLLGSLWRVIHEHFTGEKWIPARVQEVRDIEEYFDILEYLKYRGLYEYARRRALREEHVDVERLIEEARRDLERRRAILARLEEEKRRLLVETGDRRSPAIRAINRQIERLQAEATKYVELTPWAAAALYYYQRYTSTVYGFEPGTPWTNIMRALPSGEREYFTYFAQTTSPEERRKILELVPKSHRRIYQAIWGLPVEPRVPLEEYFRTHYLPGPEWAGWRPEVNLEDVKVRVVTSMGKDIYDFDIWPNDVERASRPGIPTIPQPFVPNVGGAELRRRLEEILLGLGLEDVSVSVSPADRMRVEIELTRDRTEEIRERLRKDLPVFIAA